MANKRRVHRRESNYIVDVISSKAFKIIVSILIACILVFSLIYEYINYNEKQKVAQEKARVAEEIDDIYNNASNDYDDLNNYKTNKIIRISAVGDILCGSNLQKYGQDYNTIFSDISKYLSDSDLNIGTFEFNVDDSNKEFANALKKSGIGLVSIAHNHSLDNGKESLDATEKYLEDNKIDTVGKSSDNASERVTIKEIRGVKIAFLAYTYNNRKEGVNIFSEELVKEDLKYAKENSAFSIVMMHWGNANSNSISNEQSEQAQFLVDNGANVIIGAHPSTVQKMEIVKNSDGKDCLIAYSLGDYTSDFAIENSNLELILNMQIFVDKDGNASIYKVDYTPVYMQDFGNKLTENRFKILDMKKEIANYDTSDSAIDKNTYEKLIRGLNKLKEVLELEK